MTINSLPSEILMNEVFPHLEGKDLEEVVQVCRLWNSIASDPIFLKNFLLSGKSLSSFQISHILHNSTTRDSLFKCLKDNSSKISKLSRKNLVLSSSKSIPLTKNELTLLMQISPWNLLPKLAKLVHSKIIAKNLSKRLLSENREIPSKIRATCIKIVCMIARRNEVATFFQAASPKLVEITIIATAFLHSSCKPGAQCRIMESVNGIKLDSAQNQEKMKAFRRAIDSLTLDSLPEKLRENLQLNKNNDLIPVYRDSLRHSFFSD